MTAEPPVMNAAPESAALEAAASDERLAMHPAPVTSLSDPRAVQILSTEHWSLLASRSLAYNEAFIRGGMFLTFLSMSFVGLALLAQAMSFTSQFLIAAVVVLVFDFIIGMLTFVRIAGANVDDLRSVHGMARIRHGYTEIAPVVAPYFTSATHDDIDSVLTAYGSPSKNALEELAYGLSTSGGMIGLITAMVGGVLAALVAFLLGAGGEVAILLGVVAGAVVFALLVFLTFRAAAGFQVALGARFPAPPEATPEEPAATQ